MTVVQPGQPRANPSSPASRMSAAPSAPGVWVPNWSSTAATCGTAGQWQVGMIVGRGGTTVVSDLPTSDGLAGNAGPQRPIEECGNPRATARGRRIAPPGQQTATVLGGSGGV